MVIFTLIFSFIARIPSDGLPYPIFSYSALLPWTLLSTSLTMAVPSLVNNMNLVTKVYFPREILPIAAVAASFVDFLVAGMIFVGLMAYYGFSIGISAVFIPLILAAQVLLIVGVTLWASALNVFYRDIRFVIPLAVQLWMYLTPIIYPVSIVPEQYRPFYMLNPMASIVDGYRRVLLLGQYPDAVYLAFATMLAIAILAFGYRYFKQAELKFADLI